MFATFARTGSAVATVKAFRAQSLHFPRRRHLSGSSPDAVLWAPLEHWQVLRVLHSPWYAGAYAFGRTRTRRQPGGELRTQQLPRAQWQVLLPDHHPGYITWEVFEANQERLRANARAQGAERRQGPPREGPALLQGVVLCGRCGQRMTVRYKQRRQGLEPQYVCQAQGINAAQPPCQSLPGAPIDAAVGRLVVETVTPWALEVTLAIEQEIQARLAEAEALRHQQVERAHYEATLAQRRYLRVDPDHRLVADALERDWNAKLQALQAAQDAYERHCQADQQVLEAPQRAAIRALAQDVPRVWHDAKTPARDRKRILRLLIEDVTLVKDQQVRVAVRFRGGRTEVLVVPRAQSSWQQRQTAPAVVAAIDRLLDEGTDGYVAQVLNQQGVHAGMGGAFHGRLVARLRRAYGLPSRYQRLRARGLLTQQEIAQRLGVEASTVHGWRRQGRLQAYAYSDKPAYLYVDPGPTPPRCPPRAHPTRRAAAVSRSSTV